MNRLVIAVLVMCCVGSSRVAADQAIVTTTDFSSGSLSSLDLTTRLATNDQLTIHSDAAVRTYQDKVYVINRLGQDNVIVLDKNNLRTPLKQYSTGNGTNPQDMVFVSETKAYISLYGGHNLLVVNPVTGDSLGVVDLAGFADADGIPEMNSLALYNGRLFVACQRLDQKNGFVPADYSVIAVIDVATNQVVDVDSAVSGVQGIVMSGKNSADASQWGSRWIMSTVNTFGNLADGGIEVIDLDKLTSEGVVVGEAQLGGNVNSVVMVQKNKGYVVVSDANFANLVRQFDLSTKGVSENLPGISGGYVPGLGAFNGRLYVLDRGSFTDPASAGVRVYDVATNQLIAGPIATGLPPLAIAFVGAPASLRADFNEDGGIGFPDFLAFASVFGKKSTDTGFEVKFDLNANGSVDFADFLIFFLTFPEHGVRLFLV
ncbi:MAG: EF-hand domain-containing protein [bacterium]|nr:EF-hand domain-containing protein [bacterium]